MLRAPTQAPRGLSTPRGGMAGERAGVHTRFLRSEVFTNAVVNQSTTTSYGDPGFRRKITKVRIQTTSDCEMAISRYPMFRYNGVGGGGYADVEDLGNGILRLKFNPKELVIPDISWRTASLFSFLPMPPPMNIEIETQRLEGSIDLALGIVELNFTALFHFTAGPLYSAPPLLIRTLLTTEMTQGSFLSARGQPLDSSGRAQLVGAAYVPKVDDLLTDTFLMLPTDSLAIMSSKIEFHYD